MVDGIVKSGESQDFTFVRAEVNLPGALPLLEGVQVLLKTSIVVWGLYCFIQ